MLGSIIFNFSNQAYDAGINQRILVIDEEIDKKVKELARQKRVRIIDIKQIESLIKSSAPRPFSVPAKEKPVIESKEQLVKSLNRYGYRVQENARIQGKSGVDYTFDIFCYNDIDNFGYSVAIDFLDSTAEVNLDQVSLFDTKAFDSGADYKVLVVKSKLNHAAEKFAGQQHIHIYQMKSGTGEHPNATAPQIITPVKPPSRPVPIVLPA